MKQLNTHDFEEVYKDLKINIDTLGCVMVDIEPLSNMWSIEWEGAGISLYYSKNPDRKWINGWIAGTVAHITLLYGLLENAHIWEKYVTKVLEGWNMPTVEIDHVGYFDSPYKDEPYYCIVAHIKVTPELLDGHSRMEFLPHINTFMGYKPHMTICYIKKDQGEAYRDLMVKQFNDLWAGKKMKTKKEINLGYLPKSTL